MPPPRPNPSTPTGRSAVVKNHHLSRVHLAPGESLDVNVGHCKTFATLPSPFSSRCRYESVRPGGMPSKRWKQAALKVLILGCLGSWAFAKQDAGVMLNVPGNTSVARSADASWTPSCWIYTHLQKSGGTTIKRIVSDARVNSPHPCENCGVNYEIYDSEQWKRGNMWMNTFANRLGAPGDINVAMGGYTEGLRGSPRSDKKCLWFTQFRHPIPRLVSAYFYCKKKSGRWALRLERNAKRGAL